MRVKVYPGGNIALSDGCDIQLNGESPEVELEVSGQDIKSARGGIEAAIAGADLKRDRSIKVNDKMYDIIRPNKSER